MATNENTFGSAVKTAGNVIALVVGLGALAGMLLIVWPMIKDKPLSQIIILPTSEVVKPTQASAVTPRVQAPAMPAAAPVQPAIDAYNATATAQYNDAVNAAQAQPVPNVGQAGPVIIGQRANEIQPAGDNVSVAEPVDEQHVSKLTEPVNPQETHTCLHGQVWTDSGCHRPTPVK